MRVGRDVHATARFSVYKSMHVTLEDLSVQYPCIAQKCYPQGVTTISCNRRCPVSRKGVILVGLKP